MNAIGEQSNFIFRWAEDKDNEPVVQTMLAAFDGESEMGEWVRMMMDGKHASANSKTVAIAEEVGTHNIVAVITTSPQTWYYENIALKGLNITEVGTHPNYQGQGLVSKLINMIHETLIHKEYDFSMVWGIPWFYKKYDYYQTLANKTSKTYSRNGILAKWGKDTDYNIRPFTLEDIPFGVQLHLDSRSKGLISFPYNEKYWKMFVFDYFEENRDQYRVIEKDNQPIGVFAHNTHVDDEMSVFMLDLVDGESYFDVIPWVTGYLIHYGDQILLGDNRKVEQVRYSLREGHPVFEIMKGCYCKKRPAEQNYYRIVDMRNFLLKIAPVLEQRIADSFMCGYTNDLTFQIFEYKQILRFHFENGKIKDIAWEDNNEFRYQDVHMPLEYFMHMLFGQKDIEDFQYLYREVGSRNEEYGLNNEIRMLFNILFPKKPSHINHPL